MATINNKLRAKYGIESAANLTVVTGGVTIQAGNLDFNGSGGLTGVGSTSVVTNLNADKLDGNDASAFQPVDATLTALAGVATAADRIAYFTGTDTATFTGLTSFGRSLIDDADNSAARTTLGLGSIATQAASSVAITGGAIDGTTIGGTTKAAGGFTTLTTTGDAGVGGNLTVTGNLTVQGDTVQLNVTELNIEDNELILNANVAGTPSLNGLITVNRGSSADVGIRWNESTDLWEFTNDGSSWQAFGSSGGTVSVSGGGTGATTFTAGYLKANGTTPFTTVSSIPGADVSGNISGNAANVTGTVAIANGGTALTSTPTSGQLLIGNSSNGYTLAQISQGTGITVTSGSGSISIANAGVTSVSGTTNQVSVSGGTGSVTFSLPQNIHTAATPTFAGVLYANAQNGSATATVTSNSVATTVDTLAAASYTSAEYLLQMKQGTKVTTTKFLMLYDGTDVQITEYSTVNATAGAANATVSAVYSGGNILLQVTSPDAATTNVVCKVHRAAVAA